MSSHSTHIRSAALLLILAASAVAQTTPPKSLNLVMPQGNGRIVYTYTPQWSVVTFNLYDNGTRPVLQIRNPTTDISVSYILFPNDTGAPTAEQCRDAVVDPILHGHSANGTIKNDRKEIYTSASRTPIPTRSYFIESMDGAPIHQQNLFGFFGNASTCAEIHISKGNYKPADEPLMKAELDRFKYEPSYQPSTDDYYVLATIFFRRVNSPTDAAPYYRSALNSLPPGPPPDEKSLTLRRILTDQLVISYGMTGDLTGSRALADKAIAEDPGYPLNYYNLACADAAQGKADDAKLHLKQAFDRKANTIPGEHLPDPTQDDSFLELKKDKAFSDFLQTLK